MGRNFDRQTITGPRLLICEAAADEAFFRKLIQCRSLPEFCIRHPMDGGLPGRYTQFDKFLEGIAIWSGFETLNDIVIATDNDNSDSFANVVAAISRANPIAVPPISYGVPSAPLEKAAGSPAALSILMVPCNETGNLEHLCLQAIGPSALECVEQFSKCSGAHAWPANKLSKMKLQSWFASKNKNNPGVTLGNVMRDHPELIPLNHACFDQVAQFLSGF